MLYVVIHSHFYLVAIIMTDSKELTVFYGGKVGRRSRSTDNEDVELFYEQQLLWIFLLHIVAGIHTYALQVCLGERNVFLLRSTHSFSFYSYTLGFVGFRQQLKILPSGDIIQELLYILCAKFKLSFSQFFFYQQYLLLCLPMYQIARSKTIHYTKYDSDSTKFTSFFCLFIIKKWENHIFSV
nr:MAG TPA: hypothetical protein [Caudoviricetes sp.]